MIHRLTDGQELHHKLESRITNPRRTPWSLAKPQYLPTPWFSHVQDRRKVRHTRNHHLRGVLKPFPLRKHTHLSLVNSDHDRQRAVLNTSTLRYRVSTSKFSGWLTNLTHQHLRYELDSLKVRFRVYQCTWTWTWGWRYSYSIWDVSAFDVNSNTQRWCQLYTTRSQIFNLWSWVSLAIGAWGWRAQTLTIDNTHNTHNTHLVSYSEQIRIRYVYTSSQW